jgi:hypothetical protein
MTIVLYLSRYYMCYLQEAPLPHSPRAISFFNRDLVCFGYTPTEYAIFSLQSLSATEISTPALAASTAAGIGALTGLTGYMTLGLGTKVKPCLVQIDSGTLITKESKSTII